MIHFCIVHIWFSSQVPKTCLPCILVCVRSEPLLTGSPTYLSTKGLVMFIEEEEKNKTKTKQNEHDNHCSLHPALHQSVSALFVLLPCFPPLEVTALPLQAAADTRVWSCWSSSMSGSSSWICRSRAIARSMVAVLTRLKSCMLTRCKRKLRQRLRRMM